VFQEMSLLKKMHGRQVYSSIDKGKRASRAMGTLSSSDWFAPTGHLSQEDGSVERVSTNQSTLAANSI
jgi:hypothetical protein